LNGESHRHRDHKWHALWNADSKQGSDSAGEVNCTMDRDFIDKTTLITEDDMKKPDYAEEDQ